MRVLLGLVVVLVVGVAGCGDGPSMEERVAGVCDEWQAFLDTDHGGQAGTRAAAEDVAVLALESDSELTLVGMELSDALSPYDEAAFRRAAAGMEQSCG